MWTSLNKDIQFIIFILSHIIIKNIKVGQGRGACTPRPPWIREWVKTSIKKSLAQEVRQKRNILDCKSKVRPLQPSLCLQHVHWDSVRPIKGYLTPKMNITFPIRNCMLNIFLFNNFFLKKQNFLKKMFWEHIWQFFRERRRPMSKINITCFITNEVLNILLFNSFFKKSCIFWKNAKKPFLMPKSSFLKGTPASGDENEYNLF